MSEHRTARLEMPAFLSQEKCALPLAIPLRAATFSASVDTIFTSITWESSGEPGSMMMETDWREQQGDLNGKALGERTLNVTLARPREERSGGGRGGYGGGRGGQGGGRRDRY
jgi:hypothetical protein